MPNEQLLAELGPFTGLDTFTSSRSLQGGKSPSNSNTASNIIGGSYVPALGRSQRNVTTGVGSPPITGMIKFDQSPGTSFYIYTAGPPVTASNGQSLYSMDTATYTQVNLPYPAIFQSPFSPTQASRFVQYQGWIFSAQNLTTGTAQPALKIDSGLNITSWGIAIFQGQTPNPPIAQLGASPGLQGTYYYRITFSSAIGPNMQESSPSAVVGPVMVDGTVNHAVQMFFPGIAASVDPQVTTINVYRLGGTIGQWTFVQSFPNSSFTLTDNTPDTNLTGQNLILHRDDPPTFTDIVSHKDRIWGFGVPFVDANPPKSPSSLYGPQPADLWYSNYAEPWGFDCVNQIIPIGREQTGDVAVGLLSLGSILLCFKSKTTWAIYGDDPTMFRPLKLFDIGACAQGSIIEGDGVAYWLSTQGVYSFDGSNLQWISLELRTVIQNMAASDRAAAIGFFSNLTYYLSFPTLNITYAYDTITKEWRSVPYGTNAAYYDVELAEVTAARPTTTNIDSWLSTSTDLNNPITASYISRIFTESPDAIKQYSYLYIVAPASSSSQPITITLVADPGIPNFAQTFSVTHNLVEGSKMYSIAPQLEGKELQITITSSSTLPFEVTKIAVSGYIKRPTSPND